jgi:hypothetical protein
MENNEIEILQHNISYYYDNGMEMSEAEQDHIKDCIIDGYSQGELSSLTPDGNSEVHGWWHIHPENCILCARNKHSKEKPYTPDDAYRAIQGIAWTLECHQWSRQITRYDSEFVCQLLKQIRQIEYSVFTLTNSYKVQQNIKDEVKDGLEP